MSHMIIGKAIVGDMPKQTNGRVPPSGEALWYRNQRTGKKMSFSSSFAWLEAFISPEQAEICFSVLVSVPNKLLTVAGKWLHTAPLTLSDEDNATAFQGFLKKSKDVATPADTTTEPLLKNYFRLEALRRWLSWSSEELIDYLSRKYKEEQKKDNALDKAKSKALTALFATSENIDLLFKARQIYDGSLPSYVSARTTVDLRPVYSDDLAIRHGLITIDLSFVVRKPHETVETESLAFQIDLADIGEMQKCLNRAKKKILELKELAVGKNKLHLFNPRKSIEMESL